MTAPNEYRLAIDDNTNVLATALVKLLENLPPRERSRLERFANEPLVIDRPSAKHFLAGCTMIGILYVKAVAAVAAEHRAAVSEAAKCN